MIRAAAWDSAIVHGHTAVYADCIGKQEVQIDLLVLIHQI